METELRWLLSWELNHGFIILVSKSTGSRSKKVIPKFSFTKTSGATMVTLGIEDLMISQLFVGSSEFEDVSDRMADIAG